MLQTGRYAARYGMQDGTIPVNKPYGVPLSEKYLPEYLKELGYRTHMFGKWHIGLYRWAYTPTFRGYDSFMGYYSGAEDYFTHDTCESECAFDLHLDDSPNCGDNCTNPQLHLRGNYSAFVFGDRGLKVLEEHPSPDVPMFLLGAFQSVHFPIQAPPEYVAPYRHLDSNRQVFAGMLAALDEQVGRIVDGFVEKQMWDNTLTIMSTVSLRTPLAGAGFRCADLLRVSSLLQDNGGPVGSRDGKPWGPWCATGAQNWPLRGGKVRPASDASDSVSLTVPSVRGHFTKVACEARAGCTARCWPNKRRRTVSCM